MTSGIRINIRCLKLKIYFRQSYFKRSRYFNKVKKKDASSSNEISQEISLFENNKGKNNIHFLNFEDRNLIFFSGSSVTLIPDFDTSKIQRFPDFNYKKEKYTVDFESITSLFTHQELTFFRSESSLYTTGLTMFLLFGEKKEKRGFINLSKFILCECEHLLKNQKSTFDLILPKTFEFLSFSNLSPF